ncbi:MAG: hypothetical protein C5B48_07170 [Candidatus Rokuibacteriota bacterium]|nr:MAG: hypothetical protein C5B48_07170 [Candidatus Rokubacteria bacterium]
MREARLARADIVSRVARGERVAPSNATFAEFAEAWLKGQQPRLRPSTHSLYSTYLRLHLNPRLGTQRLQSITSTT